jgi:hypothetical protein
MTFTKLRLKWGPGTNDTVTFRFGVMNTTEPYLVKVISGLEPVTQTVSLADKAEEGSGFQGKRPDNRQIIIQLGFQPDYSLGQSVESLRRALYPMIVPKLDYSCSVVLLNEDETEKWQTWGQVSKMPTNPFSKDPEMQIVIDCLGPYWLGADYVHPSPSDLSGKSSFSINNIGDAPTGWEIVVGITAAKTNFEIFRGDNKAWVLITYNFAIGDQITINTTMGNRNLTLLRGGVTTNLLQYFSPNSSYFQMDGGVNNFLPLYTQYTVKSWKHTPRFLGI